MSKVFAGLLLAFWAQLLVAGGDEDYLKIREAFRMGNAARVAEYAERMKHHVLSPYAKYFQLRLSLTTVDAGTIRAFLARYDNSFVADRLRGDWLQILGKRQQWTTFAEEYPKLVNREDSLQCYALQHRLATGDKTAGAEVRSLWFTGRDMPASCVAVFDSLIRTGAISAEDVWTRIRLAFEAGNTGVAKSINKYLPRQQALDLQKLGAAAKDARRFLDRQATFKSRADREVVLFALLRLLRSETNQAFARWHKMRGQFSEVDQSYFMGNLAYWAAIRQDARAMNWFMEATRGKHAYPLSETKHAWKARVALREGNWKFLLDSISQMPAAMQQEDVWRYWRARALKISKKNVEANALLIPLSHEHSFYGQMAREELGEMLSVPATEYQVKPQEIHRMEQNPGIRRALALYRMNQRVEANREWIWTVQHFSDAQLLAAAKVAQRYGIYDRVINTAIRTVNHHDFNLRYLAPYREQMRPVLQQQQLDEAFVYGLIRQESRFIADIKSSAGAIGLMQLMPATAKWVAGKLGVRDFHTSLVTDINTNLQLGTYYLKHVLDQLDDQPLLAAAAYNAGPGRARQWKDTRPLEGAIYAETIPFNETRDYVKVVLSNSMYYANNFEQLDRPTLKQRLGIVAPKR
ncbi:lytic transglycosylase domain-containing protein [Nitrosomonas eutropha]|uniref:lytic transglycosylase domain-containing protein n=1 Tax=Nitrosomonas eutropha TaxID=916 RepID=UPI0008BECF37|nr:lytic transglycosylase domain-containing protein [Nitrosomonas eutropha]SEI74936.1 soluble lytic murein transglycosylase [Nitrosomonas eutropha]